MNTWIEFIDGKSVINLVELVKLLLRKIWIIILVTVLCAGAFFAYYTYYVTPMYQSSARLYVNNHAGGSSSTITSADISASQSLASTYIVILTSKPTLTAVIEQTGVEYTYDQMKELVSVARANGTEVLEITVTTDDPDKSALIANAITDVASENIMETISGSSVKVVESAEPATQKSSPIIPRQTCKGALLGFFVSCCGILLVSALKNTLSVEDKIRRDFSNRAVLSAIPDLIGGKQSKKEDDRQALCEHMGFAEAESYKLLRTNISFFFSDNKPCHVIGITSSIRNEGKSATSINLAYTLAQAGHRVCLIDCDLRLPSVAKKMALQKKPGLVNVLVGQSREQDVLQQYSAKGTTVYVLSCGDIPPNPSELLGSQRMKEVVDSLSKSFDYIVFDLPPVGIVSDALAVTNLVDGMLLAVREDFYNRKLLNESIRMLDGVDAKLLGIVVTNSSTQQKEYKKYGTKYGYGGYGYGYSHEKEEKQKQLT